MAYKAQSAPNLLIKIVEGKDILTYINLRTHVSCIKYFGYLEENTIVR